MTVTPFYSDGTQLPLARTIMTFTADGGVIERAQHSVCAAIGTWEWRPPDQFVFTFFRFLQKLQAPSGGGTVDDDFNMMQRVCSTNQLKGSNAFSGSAKLHWLTADGQTPDPRGANFPDHSTHTGKRMPLPSPACDTFPSWS